MKRIYLIPVLLLFAFTVNAQTVDWAASIGSNYTDRALSVMIDNQGNKYIGGHFNDTVDFDLGAGTAVTICETDGIGRGNAFVLKLDADDNFVKVITFGNPTVARYIGVSAMGIDASGNLFLAGYFNSITDFDPDTAVTYNLSPAGNNNIFLVKLDAGENFQWAKQWEYNFSEGASNGTQEEIPSMAIDASGNVCIAGRYKGTVDFDPGAGEFELTSGGPQGYIVKLDGSGNFLWAKSLDADTTLGDAVFPRSVSTDASGNFYIAGDFIGTIDFNPDTVASYKFTSSVENGFLLKLAADGSFQWAKQIGGVDGNSLINSYNYANAVAADGASNVLLAGSFMGSITMGSTTLASNGYSDIFIAKLDSSGNYLWAKNIGNSWDGDRANRVTVDAANNVYVTGTYKGAVDFDPGANVRYITGNGVIDAYLVKLNTNGGFEWAKSFGGSDDNDLIYGVAVKDNSVYAVGRFMTQMNCDNDGSYYINAAYIGSGTPRMEGWVAKINQEVTSIAGLIDDSQFAIYPNPAAGEFVIVLSNSKANNAMVTLFNSQGEKVYETAVSKTAVVDIKKLQPGMYFVKTQNKEGFTVKKLVVE